MTMPVKPASGVQRRANTRLARQFAWVTGGRVLAALLQAISLVLAARSMAVADFGHLAAFLGIVTVVQVLVDCGVATLITRERAADRDSTVVPAALRFTSVSSLAMLAVLAFGLLGAGFLLDHVYLFMIPLAAWAAGERNADARLSVAFADGDVHVNVINLLTRRLAVVLLIVVGAATGVEPVLAFAVASAVAAAGSSVFAQTYIRRRVVASRDVSVADTLRLARPYWVTGIATQARNFDATLVGVVAGAAQAGLYSSGSRLTSPLRILPTSLATVLLPASARAQKSQRMLRRLITLATAVTLGMSAIYAGIFLLAGPLVDIALGEAYEGAVPVIRLILLGLPFAAAASLLNSILQGRGRGRAVATVSTMTTVACLLGVLVVAPAAGAAGAAVVLAASFLLQFALLCREVVGLWTEGLRD